MALIALTLPMTFIPLINILTAAALFAHTHTFTHTYTHTHCPTDQVSPIKTMELLISGIESMRDVDIETAMM
jgi:hypothetical protein